MLCYIHAPARLPPPVAAAFIAVALALGSMAVPAQADPAPAQPAADATVRIRAVPPSIQVDATTRKEDESEAPTDEGKHRETRIRVDSDDDFDLWVKKQPWVLPLVFLVVGSIFLTPVILLVGIIWYKLRKTRLQNDAMLALAARGVVPPAQAVEALATGAPPASAAPQVFQQAAALRKHIVWSDLRKGVIMSMIGFAFVLYAIMANGEPSWVGLILLCVGIGYIVLWWMEGRHLNQASAAGPGNDTGTGSSGG